MNETRSTIESAARGAGRLAFRTYGTTLALHLAVAAAVRAIPDLAGHEPAIKSGWYAEREEMGCSQRAE